VDYAGLEPGLDEDDDHEFQEWERDFGAVQDGVGAHDTGRDGEVY